MRKACLVLFFLLVQISAVYAEGGGKVSGKVINFTFNKPLTSQEVTLKAWKEGSPVLERKVVTDESGRFEFSELKVGEGLVYEISTNYSGVDYFSKRFFLTRGRTDTTLTLEVYEVSEDVSNISIPVYHIVLRAGKGSFEVFETFSVMNTGKTSFPNLPLELPKESKNLEFIRGFMECCAEVSGNRILHNMALKPGGEVFSLRYRLKRSTSLDLSRVFPFNIERLLILTNLESLSPSSSGFRPREVEEIEGRSFYIFPMEGVKHGERVEIVLNTGLKPQNKLLWGIASLIFVAAFGFFFALSLKRRSRSSRAERLSVFTQREKVLLSFLSKLDEMRKANEISKDVYEEIRREQEEKLRRVQRWLQRGYDATRDYKKSSERT